MPARRRPPQGFEQRVVTALQSRTPMGLGGRIANASPVLNRKLQAQMRALAAGAASEGSFGNEIQYDRFPIPDATTATFLLTYTPVVENGVWVALNGLVLDEGTDYTVDYPTGIITLSASLARKATPPPADVLMARYIPQGAATQGTGPSPTAPEFWYKADSLSLADGASVTSWPDSSTNANNATPTGTAPTFVASAVNGKPCLRWSTECDLTTGTVGRSVGSWTAFGVFRADPSLFPGGVDTSASFFGGVDGSRQFRLGSLGNPPDACHAQALKQNITNYGLDTTFTIALDGAWHIVAVTVDTAAGAGHYWLDGSRGTALTGVAAGVTFATTFTIGRGYNSVEAWRGDMAEIIGWGRALTDAEMTAEFRSLGAKYGIATA